MPASEQGVSTDRYMVIPRTAIYLNRGDRVLLLKGAPTKRLWANLYNGIGGHVERGEDILSGAKRELYEETGYRDVDLWLCGILTVDAGEQVGVGIFIFRGEAPDEEPKISAEGTLDWIPLQDVAKYPVVADVPVLLSRCFSMRRGDTPFFARSYYDESDQLTVQFG